MKLLLNKTVFFLLVLVLIGLGCKTTEEAKYPDISGSWEIDIKWNKEIVGMPGADHSMKNVENIPAKITRNEGNLSIEIDTTGTGFSINPLIMTGTIDMDGNFVLDVKFEQTEKKVHMVANMHLVGKTTGSNQFRGAQISYSFEATFKGKPFMKGTINGTMDGDKVN